MTMKQTADHAERVASDSNRYGFSHSEIDILHRLANGLKLGFADRREDRRRQRLRKLGLISYCGKPMRWQISSFGLACRQHLMQSNQDRWEGE